MSVKGTEAMCHAACGSSLKVVQLCPHTEWSSTNIDQLLL